MERIIHSLSFVLSAVLLYVFALYSYLSFKGFVYQNGDFVLVKAAKAQEMGENFATPVDKETALNFPQKLIEGDENAPVTIYEFSSLGCTHCADFHLNTLPKLKKNYIDTGKIKVVFVHFPLDKRSMQAAMMADCFTENKRVDLINMLFSKQREWGLALDPQKYFINYGIINGLKEQEAARCLKNDDVAKEIIFNRQEAIDKLHIEGTPAFLITTADTSEIIYGISDVNTFKAYLDKRLMSLETEDPQE